MAIAYPLSHPTAGFNGAKFITRNIVALSRSQFTLSHQVQEYSGNSWAAELSVKPLKRVSAEIWLAFLVSLNGMYGTFLLGDPLGGTPQGSALGTPLVNGAAQTGKELITNGWTVSQTGVLLKGDYIQLGAAALTRLYKVMEDVNSGSGGDATIEIWPRLRESPSNTEALVLTNAKGTFRLAENEQSWDMNTALFYGITFNAVEAF